MEEVEKEMALKELHLRGEYLKVFFVEVVVMEVPDVLALEGPKFITGSAR